MGIDGEMFIEIVNEKLAEVEIKKASYIFGSAYHHMLMLGFDEKIYHRPLELITSEIREQDGPDIKLNPKNTYIHIPLAGRYYGIGYERGPIIEYIMMAEFLEQLFPLCNIYYGGDSSGVLYTLFGKETRSELLQYFIKNHGRDNYLRAFDKENDGFNCPVCDVKMIRNGWGNQ